MTYHYEPHEIAHSDTPHTCSRNPARPPDQWVQDGWDLEPMDHFGRWTRTPRMVRIQPEWISTTPDGKPFPCQYSNHRTDPACAHCQRKDT